MNYKYLKDFLILAGVILLAAIGARVLAGGETLDDYAKKHPEKAQTVQQQSSEADNIASEKKDDTPLQDAGSDADISKSPDHTTGSASDNQTGSVTESKNITESSSKLTSKTDKDMELTNPERITYMEGFYYEPVPSEVIERISGISYPQNCTVSLDDLRYMVLKYIDFDGESKDGELICNKEIAQDLAEIFYDLYLADYRIESIKLIDDFGGDDIKSMQANNTSCFNYRVIEGSTKLSNHSYGMAIDLNPFYNPYITYKKDGTVKVSPEGSEAYANRDANFPYKIDENDLAYKLFKAHGFKWGGDWNSSKDYQHFEKKK